MKRRNNFNLSHVKNFTGNMGYLIPISWYEALPGDVLKHSSTALIRIAPLVTPVMHRVFVRIHHFFVPNRLIWDDWEDFYTGGDDGDNDSIHPFMAVGTCAEGSLADYLGIPTKSYSSSLTFSALPMRAYAKIYNEFYRDQDLCSEVPLSTASAGDVITNSTLQKVAWTKDYFTTCRPWEQKGDEVVVPVAGTAPVTGIGVASQSFTSTSLLYETDGTSGRTTTRTNPSIPNVAIEQDPNNIGFPNVRADLSTATGIPINDLRLALALQRYKESRARYGSRYSEVLAHEFGVKDLDARLQRPEYLGGGKSVIAFSEVLSTDGANTGDLKGHGISALRTNSYRRHIPEHGIVMSLMSVIPEPMYTENLHRGFLRTDKEDYFNHHLEQLGEQEVTNKEVQANHSTPDGIFGYQNRYDEYKYQPSSVSGAMRSTLNTWHLGREFSGDVALNQSFTDCSPTKRVQADTNADSLIVTCHNRVVAKRKMMSNPKPKTF